MARNARPLERSVTLVRRVEISRRDEPREALRGRVQLSVELGEARAEALRVEVMYVLIVAGDGDRASVLARARDVPRVEGGAKGGERSPKLAHQRAQVFGRRV